jgi:hypothetical protein
VNVAGVVLFAVWPFKVAVTLASPLVFVLVFVTAALFAFVIVNFTLAPEAGFAPL